MENVGPKATLSIIIVNYRTPKLVVDCMEVLLHEVSGLDAMIVLVDNFSQDDSPRIIQNWLARHDAAGKVRFIQSDHNGGFASGNNIGIRAIVAEYYLLLNSDTLVRPGSIAKLLETARNNPDAGLFSPRLEWPDGRGQESCFRFPTPVSEFLSAAQTGLVDRFLSRYVTTLPVQQYSSSPEWTSFACVLVRKQLFDDIGLLDEGYFMYFEDIEYCFRAGRAGWKTIHNPESRVVHLRGGSSPVKEQTRLKKRIPRYYYESRARFFYKAYGWPCLVAANLLWWLGRAISKARQVLGHHDKIAVTMQWLDIWTNWLAPLKPYTHPDSRS